MLYINFRLYVLNWMILSGLSTLCALSVMIFVMGCGPVPIINSPCCSKEERRENRSDEASTHTEKPSEKLNDAYSGNEQEASQFSHDLKSVDDYTSLENIGKELGIRIRSHLRSSLEVDDPVDQSAVFEGRTIIYINKLSWSSSFKRNNDEEEKKRKYWYLVIPENRNEPRIHSGYCTFFSRDLLNRKKELRAFYPLEFNSHLNAWWVSINRILEEAIQGGNPSLFSENLNVMILHLKMTNGQNIPIEINFRVSVRE
jgi:hypothetical protein